MNITVVGAGYVGLVSAACFAEMGNTVTCIDVDLNRVAQLKLGIIPIYEPGLEQLVQSNVKDGRLHFDSVLAPAVALAEVVFIAVGTPPHEDGSADLRYVLAVASEIGRSIQQYTVIVNKSTVPVGTADKVKAIIKSELVRRGVEIAFDVVSNPEFLKEGTAIDDFMRPDRIVVGTDSESAKEIMQALYAQFTRNHQRTIFMGVRDAEMTKYAANAMLATKISFMNEVANLCERMDVDVANVRLGIGADARIGYHFIWPGCGYGGSCFPKDVKALIQMSRDVGFEPKLLQAVESRNEAQKLRLFEKIEDYFGDVTGKTIAVWGLAFKPGTDDMREAPSVILISALIAAGATVKAYDPVAMKAARGEFPEAYFESGSLSLVDGQYEALIDADALVLVTEWKPFRNPDFRAMKRLMTGSVIFDGRNQYDIPYVQREGFTYFGIGR
ncbi:MAG: UDP-glucose/GDP-mannose dehydrogenase family protein [Agitococcus sp.]|nr:UDP-glucose/GDP-mannose dehydrogenase family protein [Agitococcus sp.]